MRKPLLTLGGVFAALLLSASSPASADPVLLNFDVDFSGRPIASGTLINAAYPSPLFSFGANDTVIHTGSGVPSLPNFAIGGTFAVSNDPLDITFTAPLNFVQASNVSNSSWQLTVYGLDDRVLGQAIVSSFPGTATLTFPGLIWRAQFIQTPGTATSFAGYGVDDLVLGADSEQAPVPEPASLALLATGLAGVACRTRRKHAVRAAGAARAF